MFEKEIKLMALTLLQVLTPSDQYQFRDDVLDLARKLQEINDQAAKTSAAVAAALFEVAYATDLDASVLKAALGPLADVSDQIEFATDNIIETVANRTVAYIKPPPGDAETATIVVRSITEQTTQ